MCIVISVILLLVFAGYALYRLISNANDDDIKDEDYGC